MLFYLLHPAMRYLRAGTEEHPVVPLHEPPHDTNEGGEFLDDAIHMDEVPVIQTEENIAPGSPENFL
ncbi:hypothetical protein [Paraflavitalea sp. CAU 1676]|uniref:hypothetical protein n=1 Tax=Paraflavitalea sp. CAU 1676 TaxID=3032598 RepID=UPI0023DAF3A8|nr:hypothetical protein [Paraflavitalea sp. CAU 1676]MDF2193718.1 hypothetical protein [Paraflavitalea sp. CAU 1676]